jgi:hypothetical protein
MTFVRKKKEHRERRDSISFLNSVIVSFGYRSRQYSHTHTHTTWHAGPTSTFTLYPSSCATLSYIPLGGALVCLRHGRLRDIPVLVVSAILLYLLTVALADYQIGLEEEHPNRVADFFLRL